jgi:hypothetical protein
MSNLAAWLKAAHADIIVGSAGIYAPGPRELLVRNESIGLNPLEAKLQKYDCF